MLYGVLTAYTHLLQCPPPGAVHGLSSWSNLEQTQEQTSGQPAARFPRENLQLIPKPRTDGDNPFPLYIHTRPGGTPICVRYPRYKYPGGMPSCQGVDAGSHAPASPLFQDVINSMGSGVSKRRWGRRADGPRLWRWSGGWSPVRMLARRPLSRTRGGGSSRKMGGWGEGEKEDQLGILSICHWENVTEKKTNLSHMFCIGRSESVSVTYCCKNTPMHYPRYREK